MLRIIRPEELFNQKVIICNNCGCVYEKKINETKERRIIEFWFQCKNCIGQQGMSDFKSIKY